MSLRFLVLLVGVSGVACLTPTPPPAPMAPLGDYPAPDWAACPAGRPEADGGRAIDVAIVVDASPSTREPSGVDVDGDGNVDEFEDGLQALIASPSPDSILALQLVAVRALVATRPERVRIALVATGAPEAADRSIPAKPSARLVAGLGSDPTTLIAGLESVHARGPRGASTLSQGLRRAIDALTGDERPGVRTVLLLSDTHAPIMESRRDGVIRGDPNLKETVIEARRLGIVVHAFGMGEALDVPTPHLLSRTARVTGGRYNEVRKPALLHCQLANALAAGSPR